MKLIHFSFGYCLVNHTDAAEMVMYAVPLYSRTFAKSDGEGYSRGLAGMLSVKFFINAWLRSISCAGAFWLRDATPGLRTDWAASPVELPPCCCLDRRS